MIQKIWEYHHSLPVVVEGALSANTAVKNDWTDNNIVDVGVRSFDRSIN
jgi:hypothetical protein